MAALRGLADFAQAVEQLRQTNFRIPQMLLDSLLVKHAQGAAMSEPAYAITALVHCGSRLNEKR